MSFCTTPDSIGNAVETAPKLKAPYYSILTVEPKDVGNY